MSTSATHIQLSALGKEDMKLTKDPELHLFQTKPYTYTPLAKTFQFHRPRGNVSGLPGETVSFSLRRTGDLLQRLFLRFRGPLLQNIYPTTTNPTILGQTTDATASPDLRYQALWGPLSYYAIDSVQIKLNSTTVDTIYGDWMYVWSQCLSPTADNAHDKTISTLMSTPQSTDSCDGDHYYLPLRFWFTENPALALPLVSLANTEIQIIVTFAKTLNYPILDTATSGGDPVYAEDILNSNSLRTIELVTEEIDLCEAERKWFATRPLSYLITQHDQRDVATFRLDKTAVNSASDYSPDETTTHVYGTDVVIPLDTFRLPVRQLWVGRGGLLCCNSGGDVQYSTFINTDRMVSGCFYQESWILNNASEITDRGTVLQRSRLPFYRDGKHISQPSAMTERLTGVAGQSANGDVAGPSVFSFNFGLDNKNPMGALNFSRLKSPRLMLKGALMEAFPTALSSSYDLVEGNYVVMAENYNVLDIRDGTAYIRHSD